MAMKDWKKVKKGFAEYDRWVRKKNEKVFLSIIIPKRYHQELGYKYGVYYWDYDDDNVTETKYFKTKPKALAYAKAYMRKN